MTSEKTASLVSATVVSASLTIRTSARLVAEFWWRMAVFTLAKKMLFSPARHCMDFS
mgnify:CR=1 FL=1